MLIASVATAQQQKRDVIYLKNGSIIKGNVIEMDPASNLKIETSDGSIFVFRMDEIEKMTKEPVADPEEIPVIKDDKSDERKTSESALQPQNTMLGRIGIGFQPLGFLQFGPVVNAEVRLGKNFVIGPQFRYTPLGLLFNVVNDFDNTMQCYGIGGTVRHFPAAGKKNKFYYGVGAEYEYGWCRDEGDWYGENKGIVSMINIGYRWRYNSGFYMNLGLFTGAYINIFDKWTGYEDLSIHHDESGYARFFGYLEFTLGLEFLK